MMKTAVEIRNLTKIFDDREVLKGCNLAAEIGRIYRSIVTREDS